MTKITKIIRTEPDPSERGRRKKSRIFIWFEGETVAETLMARRNQDDEQFAGVAREAAELAGLSGLGDLALNRATADFSTMFQNEGWLKDENNIPYDLHVVVNRSGRATREDGTPKRQYNRRTPEEKAAAEQERENRRKEREERRAARQKELEEYHRGVAERRAEREKKREEREKQLAEARAKREQERKERESQRARPTEEQRSFKKQDVDKIEDDGPRGGRPRVETLRLN